MSCLHSVVTMSRILFLCTYVTSIQIFNIAWSANNRKSQTKESLSKKFKEYLIIETIKFMMIQVSRTNYSNMKIITTSIFQANKKCVSFLRVKKVSVLVI